MSWSFIMAPGWSLCDRRDDARRASQHSDGTLLAASTIGTGGGGSLSSLPMAAAWHLATVSFHATTVVNVLGRVTSATKMTALASRARSAATSVHSAGTSTSYNPRMLALRRALTMWRTAPSPQLP